VTQVPAAIDQAEPPVAKRPKGPLTPKVRKAVELMVWQGLDLADAARAAGIDPPHRFRIALAKPVVMAYLKSERKVLCAGELPRNIERLKAIRDAAENMPAVHAIRDLEQIAADETIRSDARVQERPGMVIVVVPAPQAIKPHQQIIDAQPLQTDE
jgi:hypothetical protein